MESFIKTFNSDTNIYAENVLRLIVVIKLGSDRFFIFKLSYNVREISCVLAYFTGL